MIKKIIGIEKRNVTESKTISEMKKRGVNGYYRT